jgi:hypothetical protein
MQRNLALSRRDGSGDLNSITDSEGKTLQAFSQYQTQPMR